MPGDSCGPARLRPRVPSARGAALPAGPARSPRREQSGPAQRDRRRHRSLPPSRPRGGAAPTRPFRFPLRQRRREGPGAPPGGQRCGRAASGATAAADRPQHRAGPARRTAGPAAIFPSRPAGAGAGAHGPRGPAGERAGRRAGAAGGGCGLCGARWALPGVLAGPGARPRLPRGGRIAPTAGDARAPPPLCCGPAGGALRARGRPAGAAPGPDGPARRWC